MNSACAIYLFAIFSLSLVAVTCLAADFFYFVQQWPGSSCVGYNNNNGCCYPANKKPAKDFAIAGLRPAFNNGSEPQFCRSNTVFPIFETSNLTKSLGKYWPRLDCPARDERTLWAAEWRQYGTCSGIGLNQYFSNAIAYKKQTKVLSALATAGIKPNGKLYNTGDISEAIRVKVGQMPGLWCNKDKSGKSQLYQVVLCGQGKKIIDCSGISQTDKCSGAIKFPSFKA